MTLHFTRKSEARHLVPYFLSPIWELANRRFYGFWHQDNGYVPIGPVHYATCWIALEDATIENGCIWIMPRTRRVAQGEHGGVPIHAVPSQWSDPERGHAQGLHRTMH